MYMLTFILVCANMSLWSWVIFAKPPLTTSFSFSFGIHWFTLPCGSFPCNLITYVFLGWFLNLLPLEDCDRGFHFNCNPHDLFPSFSLGDLLTSFPKDYDKASHFGYIPQAFSPLSNFGFVWEFKKQYNIVHELIWDVVGYFQNSLVATFCCYKVDMSWRWNRWWRVWRLLVFEELWLHTLQLS